jgi:hypothetical protein
MKRNSLTKEQLNETVKVTCYGETKSYKRSKALDFFLKGMNICDPDSSEYERYENIYWQLREGEMEASDMN